MFEKRRGVLNKMGFVKGVSLGENQSNLFGNINFIRCVKEVPVQNFNIVSRQLSIECCSNHKYDVI